MGHLRRKRRGLPEEASAGPGSADVREAEKGKAPLATGRVGWVVAVLQKVCPGVASSTLTRPVLHSFSERWSRRFLERNTTSRPEDGD